MSTSIESRRDFAKQVLHHPALPAVREMVQRRLFERFRKATPAEREIINSIMDAESLFFTELAVIEAESKEIDN